MTFSCVIGRLLVHRYAITIYSYNTIQSSIKTCIL